MSNIKKLQRSIQQLCDQQPDDQRLRDHLEGLAKDTNFSGLTWFWGPLLYQRNRVVFRSFILNHFSDWLQVKTGWRRIDWSKHQSVLESWLDQTRQNRDLMLTRRLLRWRYAAKSWGIDSAKWRQGLVGDYQAAISPANRAIVLDEYDEWFDIDQATAVLLLQDSASNGNFILKHLPRNFWGEDKRVLWTDLADIARGSENWDFFFDLYRRQVPMEQWRKEVLDLARQVEDPTQLCSELEKRHPDGWGLKRGGTLLQLLELRGRDVMPYVRLKLKDTIGGWYGDQAKPFVTLAEAHGWWDLWSAAIRVDRNNKLFNAAVAKLVFELPELPEAERVTRLALLGGVSREWNWNGFGFAQTHALDDRVASALYQRFPQLVHGPFKPNITPTWWQGFPELLQAAQEKNDTDLVDLLASRYATRIQYDHGYQVGSKQQVNQMMRTAESLAEHYEALAESSPAEFARRAANVLTRIPAYAIFEFKQLLKSNRLARLFFVRSQERYLAEPGCLQDLVEGSDIQVQQLAYRTLALDDYRARKAAVKSLDILLGTLLRPLHRKTRLAAFQALYNASRDDKESAQRIVERAREALRLPSIRYPREQLIQLIARIVHDYPDLRHPEEQPTVFRREKLHQ